MQIRNLFQDLMLIFAHPNLEIFFDKELTTLEEWINDLVNSNIHFELNKQNLRKYIERENEYSSFFSIAKASGLKFSIGSDIHLYPGNYLKVFNNLIQVIDLYDLTAGDFLRLP